MFFQILVVFLAASSTIADNLCCLPREDSQMSARFIEVDNDAELLMFHCNGSVNYELNKTSIDCFRTSPHPYFYMFRQISDYKTTTFGVLQQTTSENTVTKGKEELLIMNNFKNRLYMYYPSDKTCDVSKGELFDLCIPEGEEVSDMYLGMGNFDSFPVKTYKVKYLDSYAYKTLGAKALEKKVCSLVAQNYFDPSEVIVQSMVFYNYTPGSSDPSVFVIPKACHPDNQAQSDTKLRFEHVRSHKLKHVPFL